MRKTAVLALAVLLSTTTALTALEVGLGTGYRYQLSGLTDFATYQAPLQVHAFQLDLRAWPFPLQMSLGVTSIALGPLGTSTWLFGNVSLSADWWFIDRALGATPFSWYLGAGAWTSFPLFGVGVRAPVGLRWAPMGKATAFEAWLEVSPTLGAWIAPLPGLVYGVQAGLGVRYWFGR